MYKAWKSVYHQPHRTRWVPTWTSMSWTSRRETIEEARILSTSCRSTRPLCHRLNPKGTLNRTIFFEKMLETFSNTIQRQAQKALRKQWHVLQQSTQVQEQAHQQQMEFAVQSERASNYTQHRQCCISYVVSVLYMCITAYPSSHPQELLCEVYVTNPM